MISATLQAIVGLCAFGYAIAQANHHRPGTRWTTRALVALLGAGGVWIAVRATGWPWWQ